MNARLQPCASRFLAAYKEDRSGNIAALPPSPACITGLEKVMNKILFPAFLALCIGSAFAQSATVTTTDEKGKVEAVTPAKQAAAEKSADAFCLRETGSHLRAIRNDHSEHAVECVAAPGHAYTREDIERTGAITTSEALRQLDPSVRIRDH